MHCPVVQVQLFTLCTFTIFYHDDAEEQPLLLLDRKDDKLKEYAAFSK